MRSFALLKTNTFATIESIHQLEPLVPNPHQRLGVEAWMGEEVATGSVLWRLVPHSRSSPVLRQSSAISNPYLTRDRPRGVLRRSCARPGRGLRSIQRTRLGCTLTDGRSKDFRTLSVYEEKGEPLHTPGYVGVITAMHASPQHAHPTHSGLVRGSENIQLWNRSTSLMRRSGLERGGRA